MGHLIQNKIAHVKSLPRLQGNEILPRIKGIEGLSQRQAARILGGISKSSFYSIGKREGTKRRFHYFYLVLRSFCTGSTRTFPIQ